MTEIQTFTNEIENVINKYSMENGSNTPDFILATYLSARLQAFELATNARTEWYGNKKDVGALHQEGDGE